MRPLGSLFVALLVLTACPKKKEEPAPEVPKPPAAKAKTAEVEFFGTFSKGTTQVAKAVFVTMQEPCSPVPAEAHLFGQMELDSEKIFAEFFPPQGSKGHVCAFGLSSDGQVVAFAAYAKNPVTFQGEGEVIVDHVDLKLEPLAVPAPLPKGM